MLQPSDIQTGNVLEGPGGEVRVAARILTDQGYFIVLQPDEGMGGLLHESTLLDRDDYKINTSVAANGLGTVENESEAAALRSDVERLTKLTQALLDERTTGQTATPDPAGPTPDVVAPETNPTPQSPGTDPDLPVPAAQDAPPAPAEPTVPVSPDPTPPTDTQTAPPAGTEPAPGAPGGTVPVS